MQYEPDAFEIKQEYYRRASQFLHEHPFQNKIHKEVWEMHTEGHSIRDIVDHFQSKRIKTYKNKVLAIISHFAEAMRAMDE